MNYLQGKVYNFLAVSPLIFEGKVYFLPFFVMRNVDMAMCGLLICKETLPNKSPNFTKT